MTDGRVQVTDPALAETLRTLEARLARLEAHLDLAPPDPAPHSADEAAAHRDAADPDTATPPDAEQDLEFMVGQNWLASVGILVLTCGVGLALLLPLAGLPPFVPSLAGGVVALVLVALAFRWHATFELVAGYFRGAGMALFYCSVLRLYFFGAEHVLSTDRLAGQLLLVVVVAVNVAVALHRRSSWLLALALLTGFVSVVAIGGPWVVFSGITLLLAIGAWAVLAHGWAWLPLFVIPAGYLAHTLWLINRPWQGRSVELVARPAAGVFFVLAYVLINAVAPLLRRDRAGEDVPTVVAMLLNCGAGYLLFFLATMGAAPGVFGPAHLTAAVVFLGLAIGFRQGDGSQVATFVFAMTGYLALSAALARLIPIPTLFIWLSAQSLLVVATALWFRSKLIVVGNFFIYLGILLAYTVVDKSETGISLVFGIVALLTARILRWQQERLELRTEMMRNAYLASAFLIFPYALYHLVRSAFVPVSWVGIAVAYYLMNLVVRSPKYRWMGHLTLLLTAMYMIMVGIFQLAPGYRIASFLLLGTVLLIVSLVFTLVRARRREALEDRAAAAPRLP